MNTKPIKLSPKQKEVIKCLQSGYMLVTSSESRGADVAHINGHQFHITGRVFWNLVEAGLIYQSDIKDRFQYVLSTKGRELIID